MGEYGHVALILKSAVEDEESKLWMRNILEEYLVPRHLPAWRALTGPLLSRHSTYFGFTEVWRNRPNSNMNRASIRFPDERGEMRWSSPNRSVV